MGYYIQTDHIREKGMYLVRHHGGQIIAKPEKLSDIPEGKALIVVVDNGPFEAAALAYNQDEFEAFIQPSDHRPKTFVVMDKELAYKLAGYKPRI